MKAALILVDMQKDYLAAPGLEPAAGQIVGAAKGHLEYARRKELPIIHVRTTVTRDPDNRMPHWKELGKWICVDQTKGHEFATGLEPLDGERVIDKQFFSGFADGKLEETLRAAGCDALILAGIHLHACVRATALDAYARGFRVLVAEDAVGTDDPVHGAITRRYLSARGVRFLTSAETAFLITSLPDRPGRTAMGERLFNAGKSFRYSHEAPADRYSVLWEIDEDIGEAITAKARALHDQWVGRKPTSASERAAFLRRLAEMLTAREQEFADHICTDVGKPITMARGEVRRSVALLHATANLEGDPLAATTTAGTQSRRMPLGVVAAITPWNNPLAIPVGRIAPAYFYDNAVLWKPAPAATMIARRFLDLWRQAGGTGLELITGAGAAAARVVEGPHVAGVTLSGSAAAGLALQEIAARRRVPFQAELGGNNAAIIWNPTDLADACRQVVAAAFGFAGQRCTANRRVILPADGLEMKLESLVAATRALPFGDPGDEATLVGPLISIDKAVELNNLRACTKESNLLVIEPHEAQANRHELLDKGFYFPPILVLCDDPTHEIVQEESFGPVLVVQPARDFDHAMQLCNGVRQGLVAALFSNDKKLQERFLREAQAGILKINQATADADAVSPFGGWKASGIGPAEHGIADREFFTRMQTVYGLT